MIIARVAGAIALLLFTLVPAHSAYADCSQADRLGGSCSEVTTDTSRDQVTIGRSESSPGSPGGESSTSGSTAGSGSSWWSPPPIRTEATLGSSECDITVQGLCRGQAPAKTTPSSSSVETPPSPPRYASELRSFRPQRPSITVEPDGWTLPALSTNFVARAERHRVRGELLGWPVEVRFTPVAYHWAFGDGSSASRGHPGSTWAGSGARQFDATSTSHTYRRPGSYRVSLHVDYRVEFRFEGETFEDIRGRVSADASSVTVRVLTVSPLLFAR